MAALSPAKALLCAVQAADSSDISTLRSLISQYRKHLNTSLILRVLLSHLPENTDPADYVPFLEDLVAGDIMGELPVDSSSVEALDEEHAKRKARKLHLLPLAWPHHPSDVPLDPLVLFLIHRSLRIDETTGLITQIPSLVEPFLQRSLYLRGWFITSVIPLLRFYYEYHPEEKNPLTIAQFEELDERAGLKLLLSRTCWNDSAAQSQTLGRDLRGLVGPWMYGDTRWKRRKLLHSQHKQPSALEEGPIHHHKYLGWEEVFKWITEQAASSWRTAVEVVEQWDGPGDIDTGGLAFGSTWLDEEDEQHLEVRYARSILAAAYLVPDESIEALNGVQRMISRLITLMDKDRIPSLEQAGILLLPISNLDGNVVTAKNATFLRHHLLDDQNVLTEPRVASIALLHALLISAYICTKAKCPLGIRRAGELVFLQEEQIQKLEFSKLLLQIKHGARGDDKYWIRSRNELLWLRSWGVEELEEGADARSGRGIFGQLQKENMEVEILKVLLGNSHYSLVRSIYETNPEKPISQKVLEETILAAAMNAYDNATNPNKTRGGVKKAYDILTAFPELTQGSSDATKLQHLLDVTHAAGNYKLVFKQGESFRPVALRVHPDPISIIGKILDQNPRSYSKISDLVDMGKSMVLAGLPSQKTSGNQSTILHETDLDINEQLSAAEKRVISMCIDAALAEDDFETAYSYVVTRLQDVSEPAHARSPAPDRMPQGLFLQLPPKVIDDWSWRAALQAGKYQRSSRTIKPTHLGNASANPDIRHLEQRMECLSLALRLAPKGTLKDILNAYRRCEEELESQNKQEAEKEDAWDTQGDNTMPGGFDSTPSGQSRASRGVDEAPMSLFDLSRASMARAQSGFSSLALAKGSKQAPKPQTRASGESERSGTTDSGASGPVRKRDQLRNAAVGGLASGVGWILGAPPVKNKDNDDSQGR